MTYRSRAFLVVTVLAAIAGALTGCSPATDVSREPSAEEIQQAKDKRAKAAEERTDLTPEQREGLRRYNQGGGTGGRSGPPTGQGR